MLATGTEPRKSRENKSVYFFRGVRKGRLAKFDPAVPDSTSKTQSIPDGV